MARAKRTLWATTKVDNKVIPIYRIKDDFECDGYTWFTERGVYVCVCESVFNDPERLDEVLIHGFVHVLEAVFAVEFAQPEPEDCTHAAFYVGRYLPVLIRNLKQV